MQSEIQRFEALLALHCAPTLMGMKPSNLISVSKDNFPNWRNLFSLYSNQFRSKGISLFICCNCQKKILLLVYRENLLQPYLNSTSVQNFLFSYGYPKEKTVDTYLTHLKKKMKHSDFPHEIGVFLGYPISDVTGFIHHKGSNYKLCGYWKVYGDPSHRKILFSEYTKCRELLLPLVASGNSILEHITAS